MESTRIRNSVTSYGFTLIELLIVVAIIAILAAIALPNFLEAQIRAKASRVKADQRTLAAGLEVYRVDNNGYPDMFPRLLQVTTPVAYLTSLPSDPFMQAMPFPGGSPPPFARTYRYGAMPPENSSRYIISSPGPDKDADTYRNDEADKGETATWEADNMAIMLYPGYSTELFGSGAISNEVAFRYVQYDTTNGTVSDGDLFRPSDHQFP